MHNFKIGIDVILGQCRLTRVDVHTFAVCIVITNMINMFILFAFRLFSVILGISVYLSLFLPFFVRPCLITCTSLIFCAHGLFM